MSDLLGYAFVSIPLIGAFAMFAIGITAIYRASRVLNLAHGAMAMVPAYVNHALVNGLGVPLGVALPVSVAAAAGLGVAVERLFVRRLRPQGPTAQTVGTVAVTGLLVAVTAKIAGTATVLPPRIFPVGDVTIGGAAVSFGALGLLVVGLVSSAAMYAFFQYTEYGMAMRGAAQNRSAAALMGINPDRAAAVAWGIGGGLAGLAGILLAAVTSLDPYTLSLQVLPAFVAALIGGLESLIGAIVGSIIVGLTFGLVPALGQLPVVGGVFRNAGAPQLVLTVAALIVMVTRGQRITKGDDSGALASAGTFGRMSTRGFDRRLLLVIVAVVAIPFIAPFSVQGTLIRALEFSIIAVSLVLLIGWVGQISLAHASFVGIGALVTGMVARDLGLGFPVDIIAGTIAGTLAALALGSVALRVRGLYLAVATLIFAWMGDAFLFRSDWLGVAGGASSIPNEQIGAAGGITSFDLTSRVVLFILFASIAASVVLAAANLRDTRTGRAFFAVRGSEMAAASLGINVMRTKLIAFGLSGMLAGLAGGLFITEQRTVVPEQFFFTISLQYLAIAVVGGLTSLGGAIAAALLFAGLGELFFRVEALAGWLEIVSAGLLAVVLLAYPGGLAAIPDTARRLLPFLRDPGLPPKPKPVRKPLLERVRAMLPEPKPKKAGAAKPRRRQRTGPADWLAEAQPTLVRNAGPGAAAGAVPGEDATVEIPVTSNGHGPTTLRAPARVPLEEDRAAGRVPVEVSGVTVKFGGLTAVNDASLTVRAGEIVGLIGPNGAGKTTLFNAILGLNDPAAGAVRLYGKDATPLPPYQRARLGVARTFQVLQLFNELTVADNLLVATYLHDQSTVLSNMAAGSVTLEAEISNRKRVEHVLELLGLSDIADEHVSGLSFGTLRMVELGRALVTGSKLLMLDEPASGLNDAETARLVQVIRDVRDLGVSVLLIEHDVPMVCGVSDFVYVLDQGRMIAADTPAAVQRDPGVIAAYIGGSAETPEDAEPVTEAEVGV